MAELRYPFGTPTVCNIVSDPGAWNPFQRSLFPGLSHEAFSTNAKTSGRNQKAAKTTRSGKIMRRLLKEICAGGDVSGDTTTLEDFQVIANLQKSKNS